MGFTIATTLMLASILAGAQESPFSSGSASRPVFEVASVRENASGARPVVISMSPRGDVTIVNAPLRTVIAYAFELRSYQLSGDPAWLSTVRVDIAAKPSATATVSEARLMLQNLLRERFGLEVRMETETREVYALVEALPGRLGESLRRSRHDCRAYLAAGNSFTADEAPRDATGMPLCNSTLTGSGGGFRMRSGGVPLSTLAERLEPFVDRPVIDATGLAGNFDVAIRFAPTAGGRASNSEAPSIYTAVQEQLGLRLEPQERPISVLVIVAVERPTPN
jgi:uncharacterized protein (TIGR03435 family)